MKFRGFTIYNFTVQFILHFTLQFTLEFFTIYLQFTQFTYKKGLDQKD